MGANRKGIENFQVHLFSRFPAPGMRLCFICALATAAIAMSTLGQNLPELLGSNTIVKEGNGTNSMTFVLTLSQPSTNVVTANYETSAINRYFSATPSATAFANIDYIPTNGLLSFPIGTTSQTFTVTFFGDRFKEGNKYFWVVYSNPTNATLRFGYDVASGYIVDDDPSNFLPGFQSTVFATNLFRPTRMEFAPDGRLFVCQQVGTIGIIKDGQLLPTPFLTLSVDCEDIAEAGLLGLAFDPGFITNQYFYVFYSAWNGNPGTLPAHNRISRFRAIGDTADATSELVLFQSEGLNATRSHNAGDLHFGPDGELYASTGDAGVGANSQSLSALQGKILRLNPDGSIPSDNPFYNSTESQYRAIWAMGLRNPFTFGFQPGSGRMFINDVGEDTWEEIDEGTAGANYGWPQVEGYGTNSALQNPIYSYVHTPKPYCGGCITGGTFYNPSNNVFRSQDAGCYFFCDYCNGWIRRLDPANGYAVSTFATQVGYPVDLKVGPDGNLYCLSQGGRGSVSKIQYAPPPLLIRPFVTTSNDTLTLTWNCEIGEHYQVQYKDSLSDPLWLDLGTPIVPADIEVSFTTRLPDGSRYFRIQKL